MFATTVYQFQNKTNRSMASTCLIHSFPLLFWLKKNSVSPIILSTYSTYISRSMTPTKVSYCVLPSSLQCPLVPTLLVLCSFLNWARSLQCQSFFTNYSFHLKYSTTVPPRHVPHFGLSNYCPFLGSPVPNFTGYSGFFCVDYIEFITVRNYMLEWVCVSKCVYISVVHCHSLHG